MILGENPYKYVFGDPINPAGMSKIYSLKEETYPYPSVGLLLKFLEFPAAHAGITQNQIDCFTALLAQSGIVAAGELSFNWPLPIDSLINARGTDAEVRIAFMQAFNSAFATESSSQQPSLIAEEVINYAEIKRRAIRAGSLTEADKYMVPILGIASSYLPDGKMTIGLVLEDRRRDLNLGEFISHHKSSLTVAWATEVDRFTRFRSLMVETLKGLGSALRYFESLGVVHLDLKAQNVLISLKRGVRLIDWASALLLQSDGNANNLSYIPTAYTYNYLSPEMLGRLFPKEIPAEVTFQREVDYQRHDTFALTMSLIRSLLGINLHRRGVLKWGDRTHLAKAFDERLYDLAAYGLAIDPAEEKYVFLASRLGLEVTELGGLLLVLAKGVKFDPQERYSAPSELCRALADFFNKSR